MTTPTASALGAPIANAITTIEGALKLVQALGGSVSHDMSALPLVLPAAVVGPPQMEFLSGCVGPTQLVLHVYVVVSADDPGRAVEQLYDLTPQVAAAIDQFTEAVVTQAVPGNFGAGGTQLPAYLVTCEVPLS